MQISLKDHENVQVLSEDQDKHANFVKMLQKMHKFHQKISENTQILSNDSRKRTNFVKMLKNKRMNF